MILYDMLDKTQYFQMVVIERDDETRRKNQIIFEQGSVEDARADSDVWDWLMKPVDRYSIAPNGVMTIVMEDCNA